MTHRLSNGFVTNRRVADRRAMNGITLVGVVLLVVFVAGCSSASKQQASPGPAPSTSAPTPISYLARGADRADLLQWTAAGEHVSGSIDSRWVSAQKPLEVQSHWVNFRGTLQGTHLTTIPDDGSGPWVGTLNASRVVLRWTSARTPMTTTFLLAAPGEFDAAVRGLGDQVAATSARVAAAKASALAAAKAQGKQAQQALVATKRQATQAQQAQRAAAHAAAVARAERARLSAAKAAAHRLQHPHK